MSKRKILVVDDNTDSSRLLSMILETMGYDTREASTGEEAVAMSTGYQPEAIVLDLTLPDTDGFALAEKLRGLSGLEQVRIVAVTGWSDPESVQRAKTLGFEAFLVKPIDPAQLAKALG